MIRIIHSHTHASLSEEHESAFNLTFASAVSSASVAFLNIKSKGQVHSLVGLGSGGWEGGRPKREEIWGYMYS